MVYRKGFHKGKRLDFRRDENQNWKISVYLSYDKLEVTSEYVLSGEKLKFQTNINLGGKVNMSQNYDFQFFFLDTSFFLRLPDFDTFNTFSIALNDGTPQISYICETTYFQLVNHFDGLISLERRTEEQDRRISRLTKKLQEKRTYIEALPRNVLASMRHVGPTDFTISCVNQYLIPVHRLVLSTYWPHFEAITRPTDTNMSINYETDIVEALVAFLYGQQLTVNYKQAIELLKLSGEYGLAHLWKQAFRIVKAAKTTLDLEDCVSGWRNARASQHTEAKMFFAHLIANKTKDCVNGKPMMRELEGVTQDETLELLIDAMRV